MQAVAWLIAAVLFLSGFAYAPEPCPEGPNMWGAIQTAFTVLGAAFASYMAYKATLRNQNPKLDQISTDVNGKFEAVLAENRRLTAMLAQKGIDPNA